jgi:hypothetical protein
MVSRWAVVCAMFSSLTDTSHDWSMPMPEMKLCLLAITMISALLAGCATSPAQKSSAESAMNNSLIGGSQGRQAGGKTMTNNGTNSPVPTKLNLTPLSSYEDEWKEKDAKAGAAFSDAYTRLVISSDLSADGNNNSADTDDPKPLAYTPRPWWLRALIGKEFSLNLTAKVAVGTYETTVPLATVGHQSNSDGEQWSRIVHHSRMGFPLFLVKADGSTSAPTVEISVNGTKSYTSRGAAAALQVVLGVARATAQPAAVVTRLTEQSTKDQARAIDTAISKLFKSSITEEHWSDRDLRLWRPAQKDGKLPGVKVTFNIPDDEHSWNSSPVQVGIWTISFDYPRPSIFSDWRICDDGNGLPRCGGNSSKTKARVLAEVKDNPSEVLNYVLTNAGNGLGTIRAFVAQQDWYVSAQTALAASQRTTGSTTNDDPSKSIASSLCRRIANEIAGLNLNGFDARIVAWAVTHGMPLTPGVNGFPTANECELPWENPDLLPAKVSRGGTPIGSAYPKANGAQR